MRKTALLSVIIVVVFVLGLVRPGYCAKKPNLYNMFRKSKIVRVFVLDISNSTGENRIDAPALKMELGKALNKRPDINFQVVNNKASADIVINCEVLKFYWSADDPVDMIYGIAPLTYDIMMKENYAYMEALFVVSDTKSNKALWKQNLKVDITQANMAERDSIPQISRKMVKAFLKRCFSRRYSKVRDPRRL